MATKIEQELAARLMRAQQTGRLKRKDYLPAFMAARSDVRACPVFCVNGVGIKRC